jgi:signal transduction histidine kinase/DNA-binding response OmpR family regulator
MEKHFKNLSISNKLAAVFLFLLFMMGAGGVVGLYNAGQLANVAERLYLDSFKRSQTLSAVEKEVLSARQAMFLHAITTDASSRSYLEVSIEDHRKKIKQLLYEYKTLGFAEGHESEYNVLIGNLASYWHIHNKVEEYSKSGDRDSALSIIRLEGNQSFSDTLESLRYLIKEERETAFMAYQRSDFIAKVIIGVTFAFTLFAIIVAGGLWLALIRSIVRPILALEESAKKIGQGDFKHRVPVMTDDEVGNLAVQFNNMAENVENYYATLENNVEERTDELRHANEELFTKKQEFEAANSELVEANKMKSQFLANVSHELRTPLNSIIGFSELLQDQNFGELNERQAQYIEFVHSSGEHLLNLINNILDLSKIETGKMVLNTVEFSIMEVLGEVLGIVRPIAHKRDIVIEAKTVPASPKLVADRGKFKQIMLNLLSNAVKFNVEGGKVDVGWEIVEEPSGMELTRYLIFSIKDTGIGIKEEDKGKLFKEFEQIDSSITREYGGTGLGLVLTKRLVELHNGSIWFESAPSKGSVFYMKLPQGTEEIDLPVYTSPSVTHSVTEQFPVVLIASESPDINHLLEIYLAGGPYEVATAADGMELLRKAQEQNPSAIIMGVSIPKMDGWEVLKELKSDPETMHIPVVIISSTDNKDMALSLGAVDYMEKPVNRAKLIKVLDRIGVSSRLKRGGSRVLLFSELGAEEDGEIESAAEALKKNGFSVFTATLGKDAGSVATDCDPDVIVCRVDAEKKKSLELINGINGMEKKTPVIILTPVGLTEEEKRLAGENTREFVRSGGSLSEDIISAVSHA